MTHEHDDYEDVDCPHEQQGVFAMPAEPWDLAVIGLRWFGNLFQNTAQAIYYAANVAGMHANYRRDRKRFEREVGADIERLTGP